MDYSAEFSSLSRADKIHHLLVTALEPSVIRIEDDSAAHIGHAGAKSGKGHFNVLLVSEKFSGQSLIQRHKMVYKALSGLMDTDIHALSIKAYTKQESTLS